MRFQFHSGTSASILMSKQNAGKFRVQSNDFEALGFVLRELIRRIEESTTSAEITVSEQVPIH